MENYNFKKFIKVGSKLGNYSISFNGKSFSFGFNSGFFVKENIAGFKKVILFYDDNKKAVAFNFTNDEQAEGAFSVIHSKNQTTGSVTAKSFVVENSLCKDEYFGKKIAKKIKDENLGELFVIDLLDDGLQKT